MTKSFTKVPAAVAENPDEFSAENYLGPNARLALSLNLCKKYTQSVRRVLMDAKTIVKIAARYRTELYSYGVKPVCMNPDLSFDQLSPSTLLNHALFLVESIMQKSKKHIGKMNRHLAFVQSILFVTGLYTIKELKENKRRSRKHRLIPYN